MVFVVFFSPSCGLISNVDCIPVHLFFNAPQYPQPVDLKNETKTKTEQKKQQTHFLMFADNHGIILDKQKLSMGRL